MATSALPSALPIVQAPMAGGPSTPELTAAVSRAGGFGFLAAGYRTAGELADQIDDTRRRTGAAFGVNLFCPSAAADPRAVATYADRIRPVSERLGVALGEPRWDDDAIDDKLSVVADERVAVVSFTFGCPDPARVDALHTAGCTVVVTVTSAAEALVAAGVGADMVAVQGTEAGGHQGSFVDHEPNHRPLLELLAEVRQRCDLPMVACGGIMTGTGAADALRAGAVGVQLGTAFLCCDEAGTSDTYRRALLDRRYDATVLTRAFSGRWARGLANEFAVAYSDAAPDAYPEVHHLTRPLRAAAAAAGDPGVPNLWAGEGWRDVTTGPAGPLVTRLAGELRSALADRA